MKMLAYIDQDPSFETTGRRKAEWLVTKALVAAHPGIRIGL